MSERPTEEIPVLEGPPESRLWGFGARDWVAFVVATGFCVAVIVITVAVLVDAFKGDGTGLSEHSTQVLTGAFGGMVGILGAHLGYRAGEQAGRAEHDE